MNIGTPFTKQATRVMLLGSGELGKEVAIELNRYGVEVHACDSYPNAPAMQVSQFSHVFNMLDENELRDAIVKCDPDIIIPEVEAIATNVLKEAEEIDRVVIPSAKAVQLTMNREGIRRLAAEELKLKTSKYKFASTKEEFIKAVQEISLPSSVDDHFLPCVVKPVMSSSGKGQSVIRSEEDIDQAWTYAQTGGRAGTGKVIVEEFIEFDYEITLLTIRSKGGQWLSDDITNCCRPIGHKQVDGDYIESWQPQDMSTIALMKAKEIAESITKALGGYGLFGVELFVKDDEVYFSEVSPRPHDTGLVTLISQDMSEFALHVRALLGLPINNINFNGASASKVLKYTGKSDSVSFNDLDIALNGHSNTQLRLFGKPGLDGARRMGVVVSRDATTEQALDTCKKVVSKIIPTFNE